MSVQATLPSDFWTNFCAMATDKKAHVSEESRCEESRSEESRSEESRCVATDKKARVSEAYHFPDFPLEALVIRKPEIPTRTKFFIPELKDNVRAPFVNLTPAKGEWLHVCFDVDTDHASTLKDLQGVPLAFKLVIEVNDQQEDFMRALDKRFRVLFTPDDKTDWFPILMEKPEHASSFSIKVSARNTCIKIYDGKELRGGKGWDFVKDFPFQNAKAKVAFAPVRVWEKDGKAGVALEATMLVLQEGEVRTKMEECFSLDAL